MATASRSRAPAGAKQRPRVPLAALTAMDALRTWGITGALVVVMAIVAVLIILTPIVVEYMVKTWLDHDVSEFQDIDDAWTQGLAKLREAALSLSDLPLFLVLGSPDDAQARSLMSASTLNLIVNSEPAGEEAA